MLSWECWLQRHVFCSAARSNRPQPARSPEWHMQGPHGSYTQPPSTCEWLPLCLLLSFLLTSGPSEKPDTSRLIVTAAALFRKDISDSFHFCYPQPVSPILDDIRHPGKKSSLPNSNLQVQEVATTTDSVPTEKHFITEGNYRITQRLTSSY